LKELALLFALTAAVPAQEFEVAAVHPAVEDHNRIINAENGRYLVHNIALKRLIATAFGIDSIEVIGGPNWIGTDRWDINAKIPSEYGARPQGQVLKTMVQNLLADRFRLIIHRETREVSGYALVVAKNGSKMAVAKPDEVARFQGGNDGTQHLKATNIRMDALAQYLTGDGGLVVDRTGLTDGYDFDLNWTLADEPSSDLPSIFTALQEQVGLKLEHAKLPIQAVIVDRAERPKEN
jgi:uncharacterized protein (TIGR03435 family)